MYFEELRDNQRKLMAAYESKAARVEALEAELEKMRRRDERSQRIIKELEEKTDKLSLQGALISYSGGDQARARIDKLVGEIDSALSLLQ